MRWTLVLLLAMLWVLASPPVSARVVSPPQTVEKDEGRIAYVGNSEGGLALYVADPANGMTTEIYTCADLCRHPVWGAADERVALVDGESLVVIDVLTAEYNTIAVDMGTYDYNSRPAWTHDLDYAVYAARVDMANVLRVTDFVSADTHDLDVPGGAFWPGWVDDDTLVFASGGRLYSMDLETEDIIALTNADESVDFPALAPDGSRILYRRLAAENRQELIAADVITGGNGIRLENAVTLIAGVLDAPTWSPTGERASVLAWSPEGVTLVVIDVATGDTHTLAENAALNQWTAWSPDGEHIAYLGRDATVPQLLTLYTVPADGAAEPTSLVAQVARAGTIPGAVAWGQPPESVNE